MFENSENAASLREDEFDSWLEKGKESRMGYHFMIVVWDEFEARCMASYAEDRMQVMRIVSSIDQSNTESLLAVYDLYSETKVSVLI